MFVDVRSSGRECVALLLLVLSFAGCKKGDNVPRLIEKNAWAKACQLYDQDPFAELGMSEFEFEDELADAIDARLIVSAWSPERLEAFFRLPPPDPYCSTWSSGALAYTSPPDIALSQHLTPTPTSRFAAIDVMLLDPEPGATGAKLEVADIRLYQGYDSDPTSSVSAPDTSWSTLIGFDDGANLKGKLALLFRLNQDDEGARTSRSGQGRAIARRVLSGSWRRSTMGGSPPSECQPFGYEATKQDRQTRATVAENLAALTRPCREPGKCSRTVLFERGLGDNSSTPPRWLEIDIIARFHTDDIPCSRRLTARVPLAKADNLRASVATIIPANGASFRALRATHSALPDCLKYRVSCEDQPGMTEALCWNTGACSRSGACSPGVGDRGCVASAASDCLESEYCAAIGYCTPKEKACAPSSEAATDCGRACEEVGACEGLPDPKSGYACQAKTPERCPSTVACRLSGRCAHDGFSCEVASSDDCQRSELCGERGWCAKEGRVCRPTLAEHCAASSMCARAGTCDLVEGRCVPTDAVHCKASKLCMEAGHCTLKEGRCMASSDADCIQSKACKQSARCTAAGGVCVAP